MGLDKGAVRPVYQTLDQKSDLDGHSAATAFSMAVSATHEGDLGYEEKDMRGLLKGLVQIATPELIRQKAALLKTLDQGLRTRFITGLQQAEDDLGLSRSSEDLAADKKTTDYGVDLKACFNLDSSIDRLDTTRRKQRIKQSKETAALRASPLVITPEAALPYPFGTTPVTWFEAKRETGMRLGALDIIDPKHLYIPSQLDTTFDEQRRHVFVAKETTVIKFYGSTRYTERLLVIQGLLTYLGIQHLPILDNKTGLSMARAGTVIQQRAPKGSVSLEQMLNIYSSCAYPYDAVRRYAGEEAAKAYLQFIAKIERIDRDEGIQRQGYDRGYNVNIPDSCMWTHDGSFEKTTLIDRYGGSQAENVFWHPDYGWFLLDW